MKPFDRVVIGISVLGLLLAGFVAGPYAPRALAEERLAIMLPVPPKAEASPFMRTIADVVGIECMDWLLAARIQALLAEGKEEEAAELLGASKAGKPACTWYGGPLNFTMGSLDGGHPVEAICNPFGTAHACIFVPVPFEAWRRL